MTLKRTELEKNKLVKAVTQMKGAPVKGRFAGAAMPPDRKEQRKLDQAAGLVPFACKLPSELLAKLHAEVAKRDESLHEVVAALLAKGLK
jgi:hypothetical protein